MLLDDLLPAKEEQTSVTFLLEAIDHLLDAIEAVDAPLTRELLRAAMMALVEECGLSADPSATRH